MGMYHEDTTALFRHVGRCIWALLGVALVPLLTGCPVDVDPDDQTPPSVLFTVSFERPDRPADSLEVGPAGETRGPLANSTILKLTGLGSDSDSGIRTVTIRGDVWKICDLGNDLEQRVNATVLAREPRGSVTPSPSPRSILSVALTVDMNYVRSCQGTVIESGGALYVEVVNTVELTARSGVFRWTYRV